MRKMIIIGAFVVLWMFVTVPADADVIGTARLSLIQDDVVVQTIDTENEWVAASINMPLLPGDRLWVPERGRAEIQFLGRTYLRADSNTDVDITKLKRDSEGNIYQVGVPQGRTYINYKRASGRDSAFQVDTPSASAMAYKSAKFEVNVYENGYTEVSVFDGAVYVESRNGSTRVDRGNMISIGTDDYAELSRLRPKDEWERWNLQRDSALTRARTSSRYLPPDLDIYSSDFDEYGRWINTHDYGYVWTPTVAITNWAPYRTGRWVWVNGDYVWISYEPWGWAPYHYGRWSFRIGIGWFWVPPAINAVFWAPGFVAWIHTPTYVSWVPLAPGEIYHGHGYYGPHSVNLRKVNIKNIHITNVYVNSNAPNAVTVVHRESFLTGKHVKVVGAPANPFVSGVKVSPGGPEIKPVKATIMPVPNKVVSQKSLPAKGVTEKIKTTGINNRPVAIKENISVFKAGKPVSPMHVNKVKKPKPVTSIQKSDEGKPQVQKGVPEKSKAMPKESPGKPSVQQKEMGKPQVNKGRIEKPTGMNKEGMGKSPMQQKEISKPQVKKGITGPGRTKAQGKEQKKERAGEPSEEQGFKK